MTQQVDEFTPTQNTLNPTLLLSQASASKEDPEDEACVYVSIIKATHLPLVLSASLRCTVQLASQNRERTPFF